LDNTPISLEDFFSSEIVALKIKAVKFEFSEKKISAQRHSVFTRKNIKELKTIDEERISSLKGILSTTVNYPKPLSQSFVLSVQDFALDEAL